MTSVCVCVSVRGSPEYMRERMRDREGEGHRERDKEREWLYSSRYHAVSPTVTLALVSEGLPDFL